MQITIGERRRPQPFGQPGHVRVDTVHQGDLDGVKGLYHLNLVDEVTQFQFIGSVEYIQAACLKPVLEALLRAFPFILHGFHADNGSEFINRDVAALLEAMHIDAFTKSPRPPLHRQRPGREQERLGHPQAPRLRPHPQPLRRASPCFQPAVPVALPQLPPALLLPQRRGGRQGPGAQALSRRRHHDPLREAQVSLPNAAACLKPGTTFAELDAAASATSDNEAARALNQARDRLFASIDPAA